VKRVELFRKWISGARHPRRGQTTSRHEEVLRRRPTRASSTSNKTTMSLPRRARNARANAPSQMSVNLPRAVRRRYVLQSKAPDDRLETTLVAHRSSARYDLGMRVVPGPLIVTLSRRSSPKLADRNARGFARRSISATRSGVAVTTIQTAPRRTRAAAIEASAGNQSSRRSSRPASSVRRANTHRPRIANASLRYVRARSRTTAGARAASNTSSVALLRRENRASAAGLDRAGV